MSTLPDTLQFIKNHWVKIALTWNDRDNNLMIDSEVVKDINSKRIPKGCYWSCFFAADFMLDLYQVYDRKDSTNKARIVRNISDFVKEFIPGFIYKFTICNHEFVILYPSKDDIFYIDYYAETGRGGGEGPPEAFRLDRTTKDEMIAYLQSYLNEDFDYFISFHQGNDEFREDYLASYYYAKPLNNSKINFTQLEYTACPIIIEPTIDLIVDTCIESAPDDMEAFFSKIHENQEETKACVDAYNYVLEELRKFR